jgi:alkylation response protein AidB-like acyl-CoA dehydrogenase
MTAPDVSALPAGLCGPRWLAPLRGAVPELTDRDWGQLSEFEATLRDLLAHPAQDRPTDGDAGSRSVALLAVRRLLAPMVARHDTAEQHLEDPVPAGGAGAVERADLRQTLRQVICGYYDLDQRDATGPGHGRMILRHAVPSTRARWAARLRAGDLAGIAMTEQIGGTQVHAITTALVPALAGDWQLIGEKCWISRLAEASVFVVFARVDRDRIAAVVVDAAAPGIHRDREQPTGLRGWSWGRLTFDGVPVTAADVLSGPDLDGLVVFGQHFAHYRPLVTATALGAAAAAHDTVTAHLADRQHRGEIGRVRDHALITIGRAHAQINSGLLATLHTQRLAAADDPAASLWARNTKALGVDLAREATDELSVLMGATGFTAEHRLQKTRRDLDALRYADGMHDSLNRSAGHTLLTTATRMEGTTPDARPDTHAAPGTHTERREHG